VNEEETSSEAIHTEEQPLPQHIVPEQIPDTPLDLARCFARRLSPPWSKSNKYGVKRYRGEWFVWDACGYSPASEEAVENMFYRYMANVKIVSGKKGACNLIINQAIVTKTLHAMRSICEVPSNLTAPVWLNHQDRDGTAYISFQNGIIDVKKYIKEGSAKLISPTLDYFTPTQLPFYYDAEATCPLWLDFLGQVLEGDQERISLLQEWFGYCLTDDTSLQKFMIMVGQPRSGKGTILEMMANVIGERNICNPSLDSIASGFGLNSMVNKRVALIGDAHFGKSSDVKKTLSNLKTIIGEDRVDIERKYKDSLTGLKLNVRFTIGCNEVPDLPDDSAAIANRMLVIPFNLSWVGREDPSLRGRLKNEIAGVVNWAMDGLVRLRENMRWTYSSAMADRLQEISETLSAVRAFMAEECITAENAAKYGENPAEISSPLDEIWDRWTKWSESNNHYRGSKIGLSKGIRSAVPGCRRIRGGEDNKISLTGIKVKLSHHELGF
jgi:putative DNA primase/helicase